MREPNGLRDGLLDEKIKEYWRCGYTYRWMSFRLPGNYTEKNVADQGYRIGLYENRNASNAQIAKVAAERRAAKAAARADWKLRQAS